MADRFSEINERAKKQIEETLGKAREEQLSFEMLEIYDKVVLTLENSGIQYLHNQKLFPFKDTIIAWQLVLRENGVKENMSGVLLGIILATIYERTRDDKGGEKWQE